MAADQLPPFDITTAVASAPAVAGNRPTPGDGDNREWIGRIEELKGDGGINADDESTLIRHVSEQRESLEQALARIMPEYKQRLADDGKDSADRWLGEKARALGEEHGRESRRVVDGLDASQSP